MLCPVSEEEKTSCPSTRQFTPSFGNHGYKCTMWHVVIPEFTASNEGTDPYSKSRAPPPIMTESQSCPVCWGGRRRLEGKLFAEFFWTEWLQMSARLRSADYKSTSQMVLRWPRGKDQGRCSGSINTACIWDPSKGNMMIVLRQHHLSYKCMKKCQLHPAHKYKMMTENTWIRIWFFCHDCMDWKFLVLMG